MLTQRYLLLLGHRNDGNGRLVLLCVGASRSWGRVWTDVEATVEHCVGVRDKLQF